MAQIENTPGNKPVELTPDEVALAAQGKFKEIHERKLAQRYPVKMTPEEVNEARSGNSEKIMKKFHK